EEIVLARRSADVVHDVEKVRLGIGLGRQALPAHTALQLDGLAPRSLLQASGVARLLCRPLRCSRARGTSLRLRSALLAAAEELVEGDAELADDRVQRAHGRARLSGLDLREGARRDAQPACELAEAEASRFPVRPQLLADFV